MQELKKEEITRKLDLVVNKLLTLGGPENDHTAPDCPTSAMRSPSLILRLTPCRTSVFPS